MPRSERLPTSALERAAAACLALNVFLTGCGSSRVASLASVGRPGRWAALLAVVVIAGALAARARHGLPSRQLCLLGVPAGLLVALAFVSSGYSVAPRLTFERAVTLALGIGAAMLFAYAAEESPRLPRRLFEGLAAGGVIVVVSGLVVYLFDSAAAVQAASPGVPARWRGLGENPNTVAMLAGVDLGITLWLASTAQRGRLLWGLGGGALVVSILASQSRGGLLAGVLGSLAVGVAVPRRARARLAAAVGVVVIGFIGPTFVDAVTTPGGPTSALSGTTTTNASGGEGSNPDQLPQGTRRFTQVGSSGRIGAWRRAFHEGNARPVLGFGFGTEERVFVPRFRDFQGRRPENSFLGLYLQLGAVGVAAFMTVLLALVTVLVSGLRRHVPEAAPAAAVFLAGSVLFLVESYVYSVGNVATMTFWITAGIAGSISTTRRGLRRPLTCCIKSVSPSRRISMSRL